MPNRFVFMLLVCVAVFSAGLVSAQEATPTPPTIAQVMFNGSDFNQLQAAVLAADPAVFNLLADPDAQVTVFAPTDGAFAVLQQIVGEEALAGIVADPAVLTPILLYHVTRTSDPFELLVNTLGGEIWISSLNGQYLDITRLESDHLQVNDTLMGDPIMASNGVIYPISQVLLPETRTIAQIVQDDPELSSLVAAVLDADPAVLAILSDPEARLTLFAPVNSAFEQIDPAVSSIVEADTALLTDLLEHHVVPQPVHFYEIANDTVRFGQASTNEGLHYETALPGGPLYVRIATVPPMLELTVLDTLGSPPATIIRPEVNAVNGVIHVIDRVLTGRPIR
jgi:transforming growth factor-beta-induced protein